MMHNNGLPNGEVHRMTGNYFLLAFILTRPSLSDEQMELKKPMSTRLISLPLTSGVWICGVATG